MGNLKKALALILVAVSVVSFSGCIANFGFLKYTDNIFELTTARTQGYNDPIYDNQTNGANGNQQPIVTPPQIIDVATTTPVNSEATTVPGQAQETTTVQAVSDPSSWTTAEILKFTTEAVNKTKAYTKQITVDHEEAFDVKVTEAPGGKLVMDTADRIIASVAKPSQEVLTFTNGRTVNGEGEDVPLLLPKRGSFTLTEAGIASATAKKNGNNTVIHIQLVEEVGTLTDHPKHHAASVGYLDASDVDLGSTVTLNYLNITYTGSTIDLVVNSEGYVASVAYKIPIHISVEAKIIGITAAGKCEGSQSETWKLNW